MRLQAGQLGQCLTQSKLGSISIDFHGELRVAMLHEVNRVSQMPMVHRKQGAKGYS